MPAFPSSSCTYEPDIYRVRSRGFLSLSASEIFKCHKMLTGNAPVAVQPCKCTIGSNAVDPAGVFLPGTVSVCGSVGVGSKSSEHVSHPAITIPTNGCRSLDNRGVMDISS